MSSGFPSIAGPRPSSLTGIAPTIVLLGATILIGPHLGSLIRPAFIVGCAAAGWYAWRVSPAVHVQAALWLFSFAPFARRIVDLSITDTVQRRTGEQINKIIEEASPLGKKEGQRTMIPEAPDFDAMKPEPVEP